MCKVNHRNNTQMSWGTLDENQTWQVILTEISLSTKMTKTEMKINYNNGKSI